MSMFNGISCETRDNEKECLANARLVSLYARNFGKRQWSFIGPGSEKKWYSMKEDSPQGIWDKVAEKMLIEFAESGCPIFRATTPLSRCQLKSKGHGKLSIHFAAVQETIETIFRVIVSNIGHGWHGTFVLCFFTPHIHMIFCSSSAQRFFSVSPPAHTNIFRIFERSGFLELWMLLGSDGYPTPRGVVGFVFLRVRSRTRG